MCTIGRTDSPTLLSVAVTSFGRLMPTALGVDQVEPVDIATPQPPCDRRGWPRMQHGMSVKWKETTRLLPPQVPRCSMRC